MWKRELIRNKIYAVLMVLASLPVVILERDGTVLLLSLFFGVPMFFAKENWIMGGPVHESKESRKKSVRSRNVRCREKGYGHGDTATARRVRSKHIREIDALVLWELREQLGFGNKRLKKFYDNFSRGIEALIRRYEMEQGDDVWLCTYKLKEIGCDLEKWEKERGD